MITTSFRLRLYFSVFCILAVLQATCTFAQTKAKVPFLTSLQFTQENSRKSQDGKVTVTIVMPAGDVARLFPADPKTRVVSEFKVLITDGARKYLATLSPAGQSTLAVNPPNLRLDDIEEIEGNPGAAKQAPTLAGVPIIDKSLMINPMSMDEGYTSTMAYTEFINNFSLIPSPRDRQLGEFVKVVYRFVDQNDRWTNVINPADGRKISSIPAGLHLVSFNLVKYLRNLSSKDCEVLGIAKSRYNIQNTEDKVRKMLGKPSSDNLEQMFRSTDVKDEQTAPFRIKFIWVLKTRSERERTDSKIDPENLALMKKLVVQTYSAPKKFTGVELYNQLNNALILPQMFRFLALNRLIENGDISDEYFWYILKERGSEKTRLGILPLDGDDMFKGVHLFPSTPKQLGLIVKGSKIGKELGMEPGYIMNYEDPIFRVIREDPYLYYQYLVEFKKLAEEINKPEALDKILGKIASKLEPYSTDHEVLDRGLTDERAQGYSTNSFSAANAKIRKKLTENAVNSLSKLNGTREKPGDLQKAKEAAGVK